MEIFNSRDKPDDTKQQIAAKNLKVLLVEDNQIIQYVMNANLKALGCYVDIAGDGLEAVTMYQNGYDIIFLDIGLPKMGGLQVTQAIREYEKTYNNGHAIIVATTVLGELVVDECKEAGVDDFYNKPILQEDLVKILAKWSTSPVAAA